MKSTMTIPENASGTYFSFNKYETSNPGALQVPHEASKDNLDRTIEIIKEELDKSPLIELTDKMESLAERILDICYSIGGAYEDDTIRQIVRVKLAELKK